MESHELVVCGVVLPSPSTMYVKGGPQNSIVKQLGVFTYDLEWMQYSYSSESECGSLEFISEALAES